MLRLLSLAGASCAAAAPLSFTLGPERLQPYPPGKSAYQFPDAAFSVQADNNSRLMFWSDGSTYRVRGAGLFPDAAPDPPGPVLVSGPKGTYDANGNWLLAAFRVGAPSRLVAFTHVENHGFDCPGSYAEWNSGAVVTSFDDGASWRRDGLAIGDPQPCKPTFGGAGYSSVLPARGGGGGFVAYGGCTGYRSADEGGAPGTWRRYKDGAFAEPGVNGSSSCLPGVPENTCCPIVSFNAHLNLFVMLYTTWGSNNTFFITTSPDGVTFGPSQVLLRVAAPRAIAYPQLIGAANSSVSDRVATLAYAAAPPTGDKPRDFVYRDITFA